MEINKTLAEGLIRHINILIKKGEFDRRDIKTANALRLIRKEIKIIERKIKNDTSRN